MTATILPGDCKETLKTLPDQSVQCIVTSPPYYGLRDYGTAKWSGGDSECDHAHQRGGNGESSYINVTNPGSQNYQYKNVCKKCGAVRKDNQIGLEETPEAYVRELVTVFRECWRVLDDDGTLWLNLGDSYATDQKGGEKSHPGDKSYTNKGGLNIPRLKLNHGVKPKDLIGIPWMVAFALRADGWYLRSEIIWHKPNPMPESVTDRPTRSHEKMFLLSKSQRYYYDADAIAEDGVGLERDKQREPGRMRNSRYLREGTGQKEVGLSLGVGTETRNKRDVWTVTSKPYTGAHFATFPPDLIEPCILAGSAVGDTVLDPFNGSGTTGAVALRYHRHYIGCELNPKYIELTNRRLAQVQTEMFV